MKKSIIDWKPLEKIVLNVISSELHIESLNEYLSISCSFDNIAKGRCRILVNIKEKESIDQVLVLSDIAMMEVKIFCNVSKFKKLVEYLNIRSNQKKKIEIKTSKDLLINKNGYLYVEENKVIKILDYKWIIPI